ncbi:uncharacterized protein VICG_01193 [Vittaforma corneae ATCC 50505]|uniref:UBX domain-containing protein n=1 Tax=Vittaforma corneae (strain ATCC 50505) TaxID=993615 RepID=L2GLW7_VITCO|nr:uncharacterized protein VICG_01193 [Vittaforma corneae ATCC 50505]ELA41841.1 hypothetical protein VICG_01193 [Vittaforma corneae ATCC 50505]
MVLSQEEMTDSEIIQLLSEYNFTNQEMSQILREIKKRDFESVLAYIEEVRKNQGTWQDNDKEKMMDELRKRNDMQKMEEERKEKYKQLLREKIAANRREQQIREEQENQTTKTEEKSIQIDAEVKIRILLGDNQEIYLGFDNNATLKDLYERVASELGRTSFELSVFGVGSSVPVSDKLIVDQFSAKAVMLEMNSVSN